MYIGTFIVVTNDDERMTVAHGVVWPDAKVSIKTNTGYVLTYPHITAAVAVHSHGGENLILNRVTMEPIEVSAESVIAFLHSLVQEYTELTHTYVEDSRVLSADKKNIRFHFENVIANLNAVLDELY